MDTRAQAKTTNAQLEEEGFGDVSFTATESLLRVRGAPVERIFPERNYYASRN
jgi:hypothetical protein